MKIVHICLSVGKGGAEKLLVDTLPFFVKMGHSVSVLQLSSILEEPSYIETLELSGVNVYTLGNDDFKNPIIIIKLRKFFKKNSFDIIHVHLFPCLYYVPLALKSIRNRPQMVFTEHSTKNRRTGKKVFQLIEPIIYKQYSAIIAISQNVELMLLKQFPKLRDKIKLIYNGVNVDNFINAIPYENSYFEQNYKLKTNAIKLFMTARFSGPKDQITVIKALKHLPKNYHVFFVGDGEDLEKSREIAHQIDVIDCITFLGFRTDVKQLMKSADINILSSLQEGLSGVVLEGLASGKPFIGSDVPGINDVVPDESFLFNSQESDNLAIKILKIIKDNDFKNEMVENGLRHVNKFDSKIMVENHIILYENLLAEHRNNTKLK